jgi:phospholipase D1/2
VLDGLVDERLERALPESTFFDPERPLPPDVLLDEIVGPERGEGTSRRLLIGGGVITALLALAAAWRWTPIAEWIHPTRIAAWLDGVSTTEGTVALVLALFAGGSLVGIPVTVLVVAVSLVFDGWRAVLFAWLGTMTGALLTYAVGSLLGRELVRRIFGKRINRLSRRLAEHGLLSVITLRIVPVAPFSVVNMVMGASHIRLRHYVMGTMIGTIPGILAITVFVDRLLAAMVEVTALNWLGAAGIGLALAAGLWLLRRYLRRRMPRSNDLR